MTTASHLAGGSCISKCLSGGDGYLEGLPGLQLIEPRTEGVGGDFVVGIDDHHRRARQVFKLTAAHHGCQQYAVPFQS
jgi:hypothetical protein